jgi:peroxiredoxin
MLRIFVLFIMLTGFVFAADVGEEAPDFTLGQLGGGTFTLSDYRGKVVYIFWFGHGCPYCLNPNGPNSQTKLVDFYTDNEIQAVGIDTWPGSNESNVGSFKISTGVEYPLLINGGNVANDYQVTYDRSMVIDQQGIIRYYGGTHSAHKWDEIRDVIDGLLTTTNLEKNDLTPVTFEIKGNYPNPFNPSTTIKFSVDQTQKVKLQIYNITGQLINTLVEGTFGAGSFEAEWNGRDSFNRTVGSGVYFARLQGENLTKVHRLVLLK